jgi:hypothetical protein
MSADSVSSMTRRLLAGINRPKPKMVREAAGSLWWVMKAKKGVSGAT